MQIVIDVPEKLYNDLLSTPTECIPIMGEFIADGTPLSEVLDSIKGEIKEETIHIREDDGSYIMVIPTNRLLDIIDKYRKEQTT